MFTVQRRYGREEWDLRQFVQPSTPGVARLAAQLPADRPGFVGGAWAWVLRNIAYPPGPPETSDRHYREAFTGPLKTDVTYDYWSFPAETLALGVGDCEDASILLCSILRHRLGPGEVCVTVGEFAGYGHAWVTVGGLILEAIPPLEGEPRKALREAPPYAPILRFNDRLVRTVTGRLPRPPSVRKFPLLRAFHGLALTGRTR